MPPADTCFCAAACAWNGPLYVPYATCSHDD